MKTPALAILALLWTALVAALTWAAKPTPILECPEVRRVEAVVRHEGAIQLVGPWRVTGEAEVPLVNLVVGPGGRGWHVPAFVSAAVVAAGKE